MRKTYFIQSILQIFMAGAILCFPILLHARGFWDQHAKGWHWYRECHVPEKNENDHHPSDPIQQMNEIQVELKRVLDKAILYPTEANVKNYVELQNKVAYQANLFSDTWQRTLWKYPFLDYSLKHPTSQIGKQIYLDKKREKINKAILSLAKTYGLFFFFKGSCSYCHQFAPIIKDFEERFQFSIMAISLDGRGLKEFPEPKIDNGIASKLKVITVPALYAVNPRDNNIVPISVGLMSEEVLLERFFLLSQELIKKN